MSDAAAGATRDRTTVDRARKLHQRMGQVNDLIKSGSGKKDPAPVILGGAVRIGLFGWPRLPAADSRLGSMRARARASWGLRGEAGNDGGIRTDIAKPSQGPAPLRSQDAGRRLLSGQSGAGQAALPLPRWQIDRSKDPGWSRAYRRGAAPALDRHDVVEADDRRRGHHATKSERAARGGWS